MSDSPVTYFVRNLPFKQVFGESHGLHVTTTCGPEYAMESQSRMGRKVVSATVCDDNFTCDCVANAKRLNAIAATLVTKSVL